LYNDLDIEACIAAELAKPFACSDLVAFSRELEAAGTVRIIGDNAGEAVFDKLLARVLAREHDVFFAVRERPIINDVTAEDALLVGIDAHAWRRVHRMRCPGAILDACSDCFRAQFDRGRPGLQQGAGKLRGTVGGPAAAVLPASRRSAPRSPSTRVSVGDYVFQGLGWGGALTRSEFP
jgi:hypothetical protein